MRSLSLLTPRPARPGADTPEALRRATQPACFGDLNLDAVLAVVTAGLEEYDLGAMFAQPLPDVASVVYRQSVFADLEVDGVREALTAFVDGLRAVRRQVAAVDGIEGVHERSSRGLDAIIRYRDVLTALSEGLDRHPPRAPALIGLAEALHDHLVDDEFTSMCHEARQLREDLSQVRYNVLIRGSRVTVGGYDGETDHAAEVLALFDRFRRESAESRLHEDRATGPLDRIEAQVLDMVARLHPDLFRRAARFWQDHHRPVDPLLASLERELRFYLAYHALVRRLRAAGLPVCLPEMTSGSVSAISTYDLALAQRTQDIVTNDVRLDAQERLLVVSGPNQGGKTTLVRTLGQLHHLASVGCPVPGEEVRLPLVDQVVTHFGRREDVGTLAGRLREELVRVRDLLRDVTPESLVILNEMFSSTTVQDALDLGREILARLRDLESRTVCVTFIDELSRFDERTVSMVSTVDPDDPAVRTYRLERRRADGKAYARALADRYGLGYESVVARVAP